MTDTVKVERVVCGRCEGKGVQHKSELFDYHKREDREWTETCTTCNGSGLLQKTTTLTIKVEPWVPLKEDRTKR